jgi:hypothetical protein
MKGVLRIDFGDLINMERARTSSTAPACTTLQGSENLRFNRTCRRRPHRHILSKPGPKESSVIE